MYNDYDYDYEPGDENGCDEGDRLGNGETDSVCDFCRQPIATGEGTYFQNYRGNDLWNDAPRQQQRDIQTSNLTDDLCPKGRGMYP